MVQFGKSQSVRRKEDDRFLTGHGTYTDDINIDGQLYGVFLRSPVAHAEIGAIDLEDARAMPGVAGIFTGADLEATESNDIPCAIPLKNSDGSPRADPGRPVLCTGRARFAGDAIALIVAETPEQARDAAEAVMVDFEELPAAADLRSAIGGPAVHDAAADNVAFDWQMGDADAVEAAFAAAAHVTRIEVVNNRLVVASLEPRGAVADYDPASGRLTLHTATQGGWLIRRYLAEHVLHMRPEQIRVLTPDVGGGFGMKLFFYPEQAAVAWASRHLCRPVKWINDRGESFLTDTHGRDNISRAELALDKDGRIVAMRADTLAGMGAYLSNFAPMIPTLAGCKVLPGVYDVKKLHLRVRGIFTNTTPVDAYRGAGRPEAIYLMERLIDRAGRETGLGAAEIRRRNFIPPEAMPFKTATGQTYDSGEFARLLDMAMARADWAGFEARRQEASARGRLRGIGLCYYVEATGGAPDDTVAVRFEQDDTVSVVVGTQSTGQGHETAFAQLMAERLEVDIDRIRIIQGDTDALAKGGGTGGSRSLTVEGGAIVKVAETVIERGRFFASLLLEAAEQDIEYRDGRFTIVGTDRRIGLFELARRAADHPAAQGDYEGGLDASAAYEVEAFTYPNGCHIAEVEIDPDTGELGIANYTVVDDFGHILNPMLVEGQVHGGIAQGLGQALMEAARYDANGQLLSGSFMDYALPRAIDMPANLSLSTVEVPCRNNLLGVKGCGEAGCIGAPAALINAIIDALAPLGVEHIDMPATPQRLWEAIRTARNRPAP